MRMPSVLNGLAILKMYNKTSKEILLTGLYKKNYEVKDLGITLPEAFAIVRKIDRQGDKGDAY